MPILGAEVAEVGETASELFGEGTSTVILSAAPQNLAAIRALLAPVEVRTIGRVTASPRLSIPPAQIDQEVAALHRIYEEALPRRLAAK